MISEMKKPRSIFFFSLIMCLVITIPCLGVPVGSKVNSKKDTTENTNLVKKILENPEFFRSAIADELHKLGLATTERLDSLKSMTEEELTYMIETQDVSQFVAGANFWSFMIAVIVTVGIVAIIAVIIILVAEA
jgi:hypothetical protein